MGTMGAGVGTGGQVGDGEILWNNRQESSGLERAEELNFVFLIFARVFNKGPFNNIPVM